jgi:hypothetical protein
MTPTCGAHCYAVALERFRPVAAARYRQNFTLSRRRGFARRVWAFLVAHAVRTVRVHVGGDFYSSRYACAWLKVMQRSPKVQFFFYTRAWAVPAIKNIIDQMAELPNCRVWYSIDRDTGLPTEVPARVRLAWLATTPDDRPPEGSHLVFRTRRLRSLPAPSGSSLICPTDNPIAQSRRVTCERCGHCWRPNPSRVALPLIRPTPPADAGTA